MRAARMVSVKSYTAKYTIPNTIHIYKYQRDDNDGNTGEKR